MESKNWKVSLEFVSINHSNRQVVVLPLKVPPKRVMGICLNYIHLIVIILASSTVEHPLGSSHCLR